MYDYRKASAIKIAKEVVYFICALIIIWVFASIIDVNAHNLDFNPHYHSWNFFRLFFRMEVL